MQLQINGNFLKNMKINLKDIPVGPDHPMPEKLKWAKLVYDACSQKLLEEPVVRSLLSDYKDSIQENWKVMKDTGVVAECTRCAMQDGGSCCGSGIENKFDVINLLINLLMGVELPSEPWDPTGCWFLGEKGCRIVARHVICVNFMCRRLYDALSPEKVKAVQEAMQRETENGFMLEEYLKTWLARHG